MNTELKVTSNLNGLARRLVRENNSGCSHG